ncbi:hypothetical protein, partial [Citrobacter freundii]
IMPGSGVNIGNADTLLQRIPFREIHSSCAVPAKPISAAAQRLGFETATQKRTSVELVKALKAFCLAR